MDQLARQHLQQSFHVAADEAGVAVLFGELDGAGGTSLDQVLEAPDVLRPFTLDVEGVTFVDSAGLRALLLIAMREEAAGRRVTLRHARPVVLRLLDITGTARQFDLEP